MKGRTVWGIALVGLAAYSSAVLIQNPPEKKEERTFIDLNNIYPVFSNIPSGFEYNGNYDHCNVIVHPSFKVGGDYGRNLENLVERLKTSDELTIFVLDHRDYKGDYTNSPVILTEFGGTPKELIELNDVVMKQDIRKIYSFLRQNNIKEARFAGQNVWLDKGREACLGQVARYFHKAGFEIKGSEYMLPKTNFTAADNKVINMLYD